MARMEFISAVSLINERVETSNERQYCIVFYTAVIARRIKISQTSGMIKIDNEAARLFQYEKKNRDGVRWKRWDFFFCAFTDAGST